MKKKIRLLALALAAMVLCGCSFLLPEDAPPATEPSVPETTKETIPPNPYVPEDFTTEGEFVDCVVGTTRRGIDVSSWQGQIDWQQVKESGVEFVMIRAGWRGSEQGVLSTDKNAQQNYEGAKAAGLDVGCYFFSQAITPEEAVEEAEFLLEQIAGWELDMPVAYDWEYISADSRTGNMEPRLLTDCTIAFCERIFAAGHNPMIYFNVDQSHKQMYLEELTKYPFWLAMYESEMTYPYKIHMWQYSNTGSVPGIQGDVDLNIQFIYE